MDEESRQGVFDVVRAVADTYTPSEPQEPKIRKMRLLLPGGEEVLVDMPTDDISLAESG